MSDQSTVGTNTILVDDEVFDLLTRTAQTRESDINETLRHLLIDQPYPAAPRDNEHDEEDENGQDGNG